MNVMLIFQAVYQTCERKDRQESQIAEIVEIGAGNWYSAVVQGLENCPPECYLKEIRACLNKVISQ